MECKAEEKEINEVGLEIIILREQKESESTPKPKSIPSDKAIIEGYEDLVRFLVKKEYDRSEIIFVLMCGVIAAIAGGYNFTFGKDYVTSVAKRFHYSESEAKIFGNLFGSIGLYINTMINTKSLKQALEVIKSELQLYLSNRKAKKSFNVKVNQQNQPDEDHAHIANIAMIILSAIGALPNLKFVYDSTREHGIGVPVLILFEGIQFPVSYSLNFRGLYNTLKISSVKKEVVKLRKHELLTSLNRCLTHPLEDKYVAALKDGILVKQKFIYVRKITKLLFGLYVGIYSSAFYFAVKNAMSPPQTGTPIDDIANFAITGCGLLSALLKWFFLGNAYASLVDKIFDLFQQAILVADNTEVRPYSVPRILERGLSLASFIISFFSLGSAAKIVENYFFANKDKDLYTFAFSFATGGGSVWGLHTVDLLASMIIIIDILVYVYKKVGSTKNDPLGHYGETHDEMIMKLMLEISTMSVGTFIQKFTKEVTHRDISLEALSTDIYDPRNKTPADVPPKMSIHGYVTNDAFNRILRGCNKIISTTSTIYPFGFFKRAKVAEISQNRSNKEQNEDIPLMTTIN